MADWDKGTLGDQPFLHDDLARRERLRRADLADRVGRLPEPPPTWPPSLLVRTTHVGAYPVTAGVAYAVQRVTQTGPESEGGAVTATASGPTFLATNVGSKVPPEGTVLKADRPVGANRYIFIYNG